VAIDNCKERIVPLQAGTETSTWT